MYAYYIHSELIDRFCLNDFYTVVVCSACYSIHFKRHIHRAGRDLHYYTKSNPWFNSTFGETAFIQMN